MVIPIGARKISANLIEGLVVGYKVISWLSSQGASQGNISC